MHLLCTFYFYVLYICCNIRLCNTCMCIHKIHMFYIEVAFGVCRRSGFAFDFLVFNVFSLRMARRRRRELKEDDESRGWGGGEGAGDMRERTEEMEQVCKFEYMPLSTYPVWESLEPCIFCIFHFESNKEDAKKSQFVVTPNT